MNLTKIVDKSDLKKENLLQILLKIQNKSPNNSISIENIKDISKSLNLTYAQVYGVATYYSMLSTEKRGRYIIRVCNSPICFMKESGTIIDYLEKILAIKCGETTADFKFTLEKTECLGNCDVAPSMMINQEVFGDLNPDKIQSIIATYRKSKKNK